MASGSEKVEIYPEQFYLLGTPLFSIDAINRNRLSRQSLPGDVNLQLIAAPSLLDIQMGLSENRVYSQ